MCVELYIAASSGVIFSCVFRNVSSSVAAVPHPAAFAVPAPATMH